MQLEFTQEAANKMLGFLNNRRASVQAEEQAIYMDLEEAVGHEVSIAPEKLPQELRVAIEQLRAADKSFAQLALRLSSKAAVDKDGRIINQS